MLWFENLRYGQCNLDVGIGKFWGMGLDGFGWVWQYGAAEVKVPNGQAGTELWAYFENQG